MNLISILKETVYKRNKILKIKIQALLAPKIQVECMTCGETKAVDELCFIEFKNDGKDSSISCNYCMASRFRKIEKRKSKKKIVLKTPKFIESTLNVLIVVFARVFA